MDSTANPGRVNEQSISSREYLRIHAFDGRVVTRVSVGTQTDRGQDQETSQAPRGKQSVPKNMKSELEISPDNEVLDSLSKETPQTAAACQGETEESLTNLDKLFCLEKALKLSETSLKGAAVTTEESVTDGAPAIQKDQRLKEFERSSDRQTPEAEHRVPANLYSGPSDDAWATNMQASFPEIEIADSENTFSLNGKNAGQKRTTPLVKRYDNGQIFIVILPDGTGQVRYPSGRLAVLVSTAQSADWSCVVVLEDKHLQPHIQALFTSRGHGTCYHNNGSIWVNVTPWGGTYCSDTGDLKKQWSWLDNSLHVHAPPCQPLCLTPSPHLDVRIRSQESICIAFTSGEHSARLHVGGKFKPYQGKGLTLPGPDMLQRHLQQKSAEINVLLQNIQSLITSQKTVSPRKVKPRQSLISQMERQRLPMKQQQSAKKTP